MEVFTAERVQHWFRKINEYSLSLLNIGWNEGILIQYWAASSRRNSEGFLELTTPVDAYYIVIPGITPEKVFTYRTKAVAHIYEIREQEEEKVVSRVFRSKMVEISPNISHYSTQEYPLRYSALNCGFKASLCLPLFATDYFSGYPDGVFEFLFTSNSFFEAIKQYIYEEYPDVSTFLTISESLYVCRCPPFLEHKHLQYESKEINSLLTEVCQTYNLPLAQCWVNLSDGFRPSSLMVDFATCLQFRSSIQWSNFGEACSLFSSRTGAGLINKTFLSHKSFFCRDITELSITDYSLVHYIRDCGSIACFTICLQSKTYRDVVLEFFVPCEEMDINYLQTLLNSMFATLKEHLQVYTVGLGEEELSVEVINSSMNSATEFIKISHPAISLSHDEDSQKERDAVPQLPLNWQFVVEDGEQRNHNVLDTEENCLTIREISSTRHEVEEISYEKSLFEDFGDAMNTKSQPFRTKKSLAQLQGTDSEQEIVVLDPPNQQPRLQDSTQNKVIIEGAENDGTSIHFINTTCIEGMPKGKKMSEKDISFESLSEHFGSQLNDAAKSFGVSRSTFKRICRGYGIKRWQSGKRRLAGDISSKVRKINDKETSRRNLSSSGVLHEQETPIVVHTQQDMNKMTVKATYEGVTIRFDLLDSSRMIDLEYNVMERLQLERKKFTIKYQDDDGDWILIACDKDIRKCMEITRSLKMTTIKMLIDRPLHHCAP